MDSAALRALHPWEVTFSQHDENSKFQPRHLLRIYRWCIPALINLGPAIVNRGPVDERSIHIGRFHRNGRERTPIKGPKEIHTPWDQKQDPVVNECLGSLWPRKVIEYEENSADITCHFSHARVRWQAFASAKNGLFLFLAETTGQ